MEGGDTAPQPDTVAAYYVTWDEADHVVQVEYDPVAGGSLSTGWFRNVYYWLGDQLVYVNSTGNTGVGRKFYHSDETGRPYKATSWPTSGDASVYWASEMGSFGWDVPTAGTTSWYQPFTLPGRFCLPGTNAVTLDGSNNEVKMRPRLCLENRGGRGYDAFVGRGMGEGNPVTGGGTSTMAIAAGTCGPGIAAEIAAWVPGLGIFFEGDEVECCKKHDKCFEVGGNSACFVACNEELVKCLIGTHSAGLEAIRDYFVGLIAAAVAFLGEEWFGEDSFNWGGSRRCGGLRSGGPRVRNPPRMQDTSGWGDLLGGRSTLPLNCVRTPAGELLCYSV